eukprot:XP_011670584.1 PREDICTED: probable phosphoribosylformylglycinamidine synthase, chloroplastic/mitochondrial [Strongylocentrotus purpuratus]
MVIIHYFTVPALSDGAHQTTLSKVKSIVGNETDVELETEACYNIKVDGELTADELKKLLFILGTPFQNDKVSSSSVLDAKKTEDALFIEIGPRLNFSTAWSTNAASICQSAGLTKISRIERSRRFLITATKPSVLSEADPETLLSPQPGDPSPDGQSDEQAAHPCPLPDDSSPHGVAPFSGATTGTGGRIRDVQSAGKGSHVVAGTAGYCFGNLHIPG